MGSERPRIIVGISGATGAVLGVRLLEALKKLRVDTHLVVSRWGVQTLLHETPYSLEQVQRLATRHYSPQDAGATIASGSFLTKGMAVCPCSVRSLAAIASGNGDNLLHRAADVVLKERRKLVLVVREAPLSDIHLENMLKLSRMGAVIFPPVLAFYTRPQTVEDIVDHTVLRILDQFDLHLPSAKRWKGELPAGEAAANAKRKSRKGGK
jgi:4-hydroxy-3-polyprenylbenzoate decarboxylase